MRTFFDTNVLVYLFDADAPTKQARARKLLAREADAGRATLSTQVLQEFFVTVTRKLAVPLAVEEAERIVRRLADFSVVQIDPGLILSAIATSVRSSISFGDALIIRSAQQSGAEILYTEDLQNGQKFDGLEIVDPFRES
ncbi:MAG: PIN domain-containing protein [Burkholderiaceae bacterium]|jgi:predicted nucleic acid-binding protein|nr:PIN domain-containing protein [Burkholderiaceae bacterium]